MKYTIAYSAYELIPISVIQSKSTHSKRSGALLKFQFENGTIGYADCHPWIELGDDPLELQLQWLKDGILTSLTSQSLAFATLDAKARAEGVNLFQDKTIPASHYLIANLENYQLSEVIKRVESGFTRIKIKLGNHLETEIKHLKILCEALSKSSSFSSKLRLDFNLKLDPHKFEQFLQQLGPWKDRVDFYEDPFLFDFPVWTALQKKHGIILACDHQSQRLCECLDSSIVVVCKPAVQSESLFQGSGTSRRVVTSYLDHPLGQLCAAFMATSLSQPSEICGLLSHKVYQMNQFSEQLSNQGPILKPPHGTGFGFDELLEGQSWMRL